MINDAEGSTDRIVELQPRESPKHISDPESEESLLYSQIDYTNGTRFYSSNRRILLTANNNEQEHVTPVQVILPAQKGNKVCLGYPVGHGPNHRTHRGDENLDDGVVLFIPKTPDREEGRRSLKLFLALLLLSEAILRSLIVWAPDIVAAPSPHPTENETLYYFLTLPIIFILLSSCMLDWPGVFSIFVGAYTVDIMLGLFWLQTASQLAHWLLQCLTIWICEKWYFKSTNYWLS